MKIIVDIREQALYDKLDIKLNSLSTPSFVTIERDTLPLGDIIIKTDEDKNVLLIERKTYSDLLSSIKDGRYEEQSHRLIHSSGYPLHSIIYLFEGLISQVKTSLESKIIYSAITSLHFFKGFSVYKTATVDETANWLIYTANKIDRDFGKGKIPYYLQDSFNKDINVTNTLNKGDSEIPNYCSVVKKVKKENITPKNIGEIILCQIPGISSVTAISIMKNYSSFNNFINSLQNDPHSIDTITVTNNGKIRKISKTSLDNIRSYLLYIGDEPQEDNNIDISNVEIS